jgi:uncharacterized protein (DUF58 family)
MVQIPEQPRLLLRSAGALLRTKFASLVLAATAAAVCGLYVHHHGYVIFCGILAALCVGSLWPWLCLRGLSARITFDQARIREGEAARIRFVIRNKSPFPAWGLELRGLNPAHAVESSTRMTIPGWRQSEMSLEFVPNRRGDYPSSPVFLVCGFPFGLWHPRRPVHIERSLLVWPKTVPIALPAMPPGSVDDYGTTTRHQPGNSGDTIGIRPYRRGDALRLVHWRQTARQERLVVRETQSASRPRINLVVDVDARSFDDNGPEGPREWMIRAAASLLMTWLDQGARVGLVAGERKVAIAADSSHHRQTLLDALARISDMESSSLFDAIRGSGIRQGNVLVLTTQRSADSAGVSATAGTRNQVLVLPPSWSQSDVNVQPERSPRDGKRLRLDAIAGGGSRISLA